MAILDPRLLPLIETLTVADVDWLAFEILEALQLGHVAEEARDTLQSTRNAVRSAARPERQSKRRALLPPAATPIIGDNQIDWAADYAIRRISDAISMLQEALDQLDGIVAGTPTLDSSPAASDTKEGVTLVLQTHEDVTSVRKGGVADARAAIPKLQEALLAWVTSTRNGGLRK
jgi:hypothetical protein